MHRLLFSLAVIIGLCGQSFGQIRFSVGPDSHAHGSGAALASNDLFAPGSPPVVATSGGTPLINVDAFSFGMPYSIFPDPDVRIGFSVDSSTTGFAGSAVEFQRMHDDERSDVFWASPFSGTNHLAYDGDGTSGVSLGLREIGPNDPSGLDGLDFREFSEIIYWSVDPADLPHGSYAGASGADIFVHSVTPGYSTDTGGFVTYADAASLGLVAGDDIDALEILDANSDTDYVAAEDTILFSLAPGSASLLAGGALDGFTAGDIFAVGGAFSPSPVLWQSHADIGLHANDNLNALSITAVPEPSSMALVGMVSLGLLYRRRRKCDRTQPT